MTRSEAHAWVGDGLARQHRERLAFGEMRKRVHRYPTDPTRHWRNTSFRTPGRTTVTWVGLGLVVLVVISWFGSDDLLESLTSKPLMLPMASGWGALVAIDTAIGRWDTRRRGAGLRVAVPPVLHIGVPAVVGVSSDRPMRHLVRLGPRGISSTATFLGPPSDGELVVTVERRGVVGFVWTVTTTSSPFGLAMVERHAVERLAVPVAHAPVPISHDLVLPADGMRWETDSGRQSSSGLDEIVSVREYRPGDERRHVHAATSARIGRLAVTTWHDRPPRSAQVILWLESPGPAADRAAGRAAHVALALLRDGWTVEFVSRSRPLGTAAGGGVSTTRHVHDTQAVDRATASALYGDPGTGDPALPRRLVRQDGLDEWL